MDDETTQPETGDRTELRVRAHTGAVMFGDYAVGQIDDDTLTLNLGWCRLAGLNVRVETDPLRDRQRSGLVLDRRADGTATVDA